MPVIQTSASLAGKLALMRALRQEEHDLLLALVNRTPAALRPLLGEDCFAIDLNDGGMGSIRLTSGQDTPHRRMGRELVAASYTDDDGVVVSVSLNVDEEGKPFEIDIWKVDFSPLQRFPRPMDLRDENPYPSERSSD